MVNKRILIREIEALSPHIVDEVYDYVCYLKLRKMQEIKMKILPLSAKSLWQKTSSTGRGFRMGKFAK